MFLFFQWQGKREETFQNGKTWKLIWQQQWVGLLFRGWFPCEASTRRGVSFIFLIRFYYRPQTKFAKVMFSQVSVCPWREVSAPLHAGIHPPGPEADTPGVSPPGPEADTPWTDTPPGPEADTPWADTPQDQRQTHPGQTPPQADTPLDRHPWDQRQSPPLGRHPPGRHPRADTPLNRHPPGPEADTPLGQTPPRTRGRHPPGQIPPWAYTPLPRTSGRHPLGRHPTGPEADPPG